ncbi:hypothetical protein OQA88_9885 [Cercophora sp. LCS_1]
MVLLTITPTIVEGLQTWKDTQPSELKKPQQNEADPSLNDAVVGNPISHGQIVGLWSSLRDEGHKSYSLEGLLRGSKVYVPPPPPKPEPSDEYKALMARLRREEEQRAYERMTNPAQPLETFAQRFPGQASMAHAFAEANRPGLKEDLGDDDVTLNDVHRQVMLIINFMVTILGVAGTLWVLARWWSTPARLFLTMGGSIFVGIAEVALYSGYIWHLGEEKKKEKKFKEIKQVVQTWVVGPNGEDEASKAKELVTGSEKPGSEDASLRRRRNDGGGTEE